MGLVSHILNTYPALLLISGMFISLGIAIPAFKLYWLIAGLNSLTKEELEKYNLRYIEKYFGRFMLALGILLLTEVFVWVAVKMEGFVWPTFALLVLSFVASIFIYGSVNRSKIYRG